MIIFNATNYVSSTLTQESELLASAATFINDFKIQTVSSFQRILNFDRDIIQHNQLITSSMSNSFPHIYNDTNNGNMTAIKILWINTINPFCICATSSTSCSYSLDMYCEQVHFIKRSQCYFPATVELIGVTGCCEPSNSLLQTTCACLYNHHCIDQLVSYFSTYFDETFAVYIHQLFPALNNSASSRFTPTTKIIDIINELMIETWLENIDYDSYFEQCRPAICIYTITHQLSIVTAAVTIIGFVAGVSVVLRILAPTLVAISRRIILPKNTTGISLVVQSTGIVSIIKG